MSLLQDLTKENLKAFGIQGLSFTMPATTQKLVDVNSDTAPVSFVAAELCLESGTHNWLAPFSGILNIASESKKLRYSLQQADGTMIRSGGAVLRLFPQQILRLKRLLALKFEDEAGDRNPLRRSGIPKRQVPAFVFVATDDTSAITQEGLIHAGNELRVKGKLSFYDEQGYILHPLYVLSLIKSLTGLYPALDIDQDNSLNNQLDSLIGTERSKTVRLVAADGKPYSGQHIEGLSAFEAEGDTVPGLFTVNEYSGSDTHLSGELKRAAATADSGAFPPLQARQLLMANVSYGRMLDTVALLKLPASLATHTLQHDFHTVRVVALDKYLRGVPAADFNGTKLEPRPQLRLNEPAELLPAGNPLMGRLSTIFSGSPAEALCVGTAIDLTLPLPANATNVYWPAFPAIPETLTPDTAFPPGFKDQLQQNSTACFISDSSGATDTEVLLTLTGLPLGAAVRVFNRVFGDDAVLKRGDGGGGICITDVPPQTGRSLNGQLQLRMKDPLGLKRPDGSTITVPNNPKLIIDIMIVLQNKTKRLFGAVTLTVDDAPPGAVPAEPVDNPLLTAVPKKGVSKAGILGLGEQTTVPFNLSTLNDALNTARALTGEGPVRDASRLPTMARRELLAAAKKDSRWEALLSGGQINGNLHNAQQDLGCPGSTGGRETANTGVFTQNGRLAYDIARMAFRRTTSFYDRILQLADSKWNEPAAINPLTENETSSESKGTFAGILLQNIAPFCETPEMALLKSVAEDHLDDIPATFDDLVTRITGWIDGLSLPSEFSSIVNDIKTRLNSLKDNNTLNESDKERLYNELKRELSAACYGRRDTQWALQQAITQARHSIYIETPGFSFTRGGSSASYALDLIALLRAQLQSKPGLRVIICVPRQPDYRESYIQWISSEIKERFTAIQTLPESQVVAFHPVGFPGRASNLEQTTIIVDDQWLLTGSSSFRRRGLTFDGSSDLALTDIDQVSGASPAISALRNKLLKQRLGIAEDDNSSSRALLIQDFSVAFAHIRDTLVAGGLGKIQKLWNGHTDGITYSEPTINKDLANPEGLEFNGLEAAIFLLFAELPK